MMTRRTLAHTLPSSHAMNDGDSLAWSSMSKPVVIPVTRYPQLHTRFQLCNLSTGTFEYDDQQAR